MAELHLSIGVFAALCVVLMATTVCGRLAMLVGQPRVVGEMVAGVLLGPSLLGLVAPSVEAELFPGDVKSVLYTLSMIGLTFYMFLVGATLDHGRAGRNGMLRAATVSVSGVLPTFLLGAGAAAIFADRFTAPDSNRWELMLFLGGALSVTAFPMLARILQEREIARTRIGSLALMTAAVDDATAWSLLAVIIAVGSTGNPSGAMLTILGAGVFGLVMLTIGRRLLRKLGDRVERDGRLSRDTMALVLLVVLAAGWFTEIIGIFSVFGGFITGLAMPKSQIFMQDLESRLRDFNSILLLPVFFAYSGLNTDITGISAGGDLVLPLAVILLAGSAKYFGCTLAVRLQGLPWRYASSVGGLMNARGLMILVFINIGLSYRLITPELFSTLVVVAIVTTGAAMPIYRASMLPSMEDREKENWAAQPPEPVTEAALLPSP